MSATSSTDGKPFSGKVVVTWSGADESYDFDYAPPGPGRFQIRVVDGQRYQWLAPGPWEATGPFPEDPSALAGSTSAERFDVLNGKIQFVDAGFEVIDGVSYRHVIGTGDLSALDSPTQRAGFLFGTNGASGARTTAIELWVNPSYGIRRIRSSFEGDNDGHHIESTGVVEIFDLGRPVVIERPSNPTE